MQAQLATLYVSGDVTAIPREAESDMRRSCAGGDEKWLVTFNHRLHCGVLGEDERASASIPMASPDNRHSQWYDILECPLRRASVTNDELHPYP